MAPPSKFAVGCSVDLRLQTGESVAGEIFAFCARSDCLVLRQRGQGHSRFELRLVPGQQVAAVLSATPPHSSSSEPLPAVDLHRSREREDKAVRQAELDALKIGVGVSREAQQLFDALSKTLPCRWHEQNIVVLDEITIVPPFRSEDCSSAHAGEAALLRVRKVLEAERQRLQAGEAH